MSTFDPAAHRMVPEQRWFEDFRLGERFLLPSRTMTEGVFSAFQAASGDAHPIHYDVEFCKARGMPGLLAHGLQTLVQTAPGVQGVGTAVLNVLAQNHKVTQADVNAINEAAAIEAAASAPATTGTSAH